MPLYRLAETTDLASPVLVAALDGWIDAAGAATAAAAHIAGEGEVVVSFDEDALIDYRSRRPVLDIVDGTLTRLVWPELAIRRTRVGARDLLILHGPEPDFRWHELSAEILGLCRRLGVVEWISLGAIPAAVPHTRPVTILATASGPGLLPDDVHQGPQGLLRVPAAALSVFETAVSEGGIPAVGFYAQVPHYVGGSFTAATIALLGQVERRVDVTIPVGSLADDTIAERARLDAAIARDEVARAYLEQLESLPAGDIPSGDELASEIERFLRDAGSGPGGRPRDPRDESGPDERNPFDA